MPSGNPIHIIAEMACSHEGDPALARTIIDGAGQAGADAIQFQIWSLEDIVVPHHPDRDKIAALELSRRQWSDLAEHTRAHWPALQIIGCVSEPAGADFALEIGADAFKIHSADLSNPHLVRHVARTGKRIDLSVGASTLDEIQTAIDWIREESDAEIWLMYGYQIFPTPTDAIHLSFMPTLQSHFNLPVGYQDHSDGGSDAAFWLPAAALGMGVDILEKHITHDRSKKGTDHEAALGPNEFARFVAMVREIEAARGVAEARPFSPEEQRYRKYAKKSLVAARDLPEGTAITEDDLRPMRAEALGLPPDQIDCVLGRRTRRAVAAFHLVREEDVQ